MRYRETRQQQQPCLLLLYTVSEEQHVRHAEALLRVEGALRVLLIGGENSGTRIRAAPKSHVHRDSQRSRHARAEESHRRNADVAHRVDGPRLCRLYALSGLAIISVRTTA